MHLLSVAQVEGSNRVCMNERAHYLCLTPTRNEAWIIRHFLRAAAMWSTRIIVADQGSTDGTWEALGDVTGVDRVKNVASRFDEESRQRLLIKEARRLPGRRRVFIALDADEALSANAHQSPDWQRIADASP